MQPSEIITIRSVNGHCGACLNDAAYLIAVNNGQYWVVCRNHYLPLIAELDYKLSGGADD